MSLFVFPEGGRTTNRALKPFLNGAAYLAIRAQVPIVPIALHGVYDLLPIHTSHFYPAEIILTAGEPIATTGMSLRDADALTVQIRDAIQSMLPLPEVARPMATEAVST